MQLSPLEIGLLVLSGSGLALLGWGAGWIRASQKVKEYRSLKAALDTTAKRLQTREEQFKVVNEQTKELQALAGREAELKASVISQMKMAGAVKQQLQKIEADRVAAEAKLNTLLRKIDLYTPVDEMIDHGHFETPDYLYETSERYAIEIKEVRNEQKTMIRDGLALVMPEVTSLPGTDAGNRKLLKGQGKLLIAAFNVECDRLIGRVKPSTLDQTLERIENFANQLEKSVAVLSCGISYDYVKLKFDECVLQYQFTLKKQAEAEEQREIREQMREEAKAEREYKKALADAEREEAMYRDLLARARQEAENVGEGARAAANARIEELERQLAEAEAKEQRAKSMAEMTRRGHVYIISNIGSFGRDIYKIGLTRRLDPMERVKELGDASVPFPFDVHAMVYVDDAPALESALHREFNSRRVNLVNTRKEFFKVSLNQIKEAVGRIAGTDAEFRTTLSAEEYFETLRLKRRSVSDEDLIACKVLDAAQESVSSE